jgi:hypothetical protein
MQIIIDETPPYVTHKNENIKVYKKGDTNVSPFDFMNL